MRSVAEEIARFPVFELDDQGSNSLARRLTAVGLMVNGASLCLENLAAELDNRPATEEDRSNIRELVAGQMATVAAMMRGEILQRPEPPIPQA
jgi:hypothetical protein